MNICIVATICKETGALSIYNQLMSHLKEEQQPDEHYYIFIDPSMPTPELEHVEYIKYATNGIRNRLKFDKTGFRMRCEELGILPDVIFSLNNTGVRYEGVRQFVYYHQALPLYRHKFEHWDRSSFRLFIFQRMFPVFVKRSLTKDTEVVVQTNIVKTLFSKKYKFPEEHIHVAFPDLKEIETEKVGTYDFERGLFHFLYPAVSSVHKNHLALVHALSQIKDPSLLSSIRIHLTIKRGDNPTIDKAIDRAGLGKQFVYHSSIPHDELLSMYKSAHALLFPSTIETIGLPLLEAASFGLPVVANRIDFAMEVLKGYEGLQLAGMNNYPEWSNAIQQLCTERKRHKEYKLERGSSWPDLIKKIKNSK